MHTHTNGNWREVMDILISLLDCGIIAQVSCVERHIVYFKYKQTILSLLIILQ